jgi:hypothetical protein
MFSVYGKSKQTAKKMVDKLMLNKNSEISVELRLMQSASQSEKQAVVDSLISDVFFKMKPKRCTHEFSTPSIANEAYKIMKRDHAEYSDLSIMKKRPKKNDKGGLVISKSTRKPLMEWVPLHEEEQDKEAV